MQAIKRSVAMSRSVDSVHDRVRRSLAPGTAAAGLLFAAGCTPKKPVPIGFLCGLTGRLADLGIGGRNGTLLAVDDLNAAGGIDGRLIELLSRDDEQMLEVARARLTELFDNGVELVVGPMTSSVAAAVLPLASARGIPLVSPLAGAREFSGRNDVFFRVVSSSTVSAPATGPSRPPWRVDGCSTSRTTRSTRS